jgi:hypothetical protein
VWTLRASGAGGAGADAFDDPTPTKLTTGAVPTTIGGAANLIFLATGAFDRPQVGVVGLATAPAPIVPKTAPWDVVPNERITSISVTGTIVVVLQERHVSFIDMSTGKSTVVNLAGETQTIWR